MTSRLVQELSARSHRVESDKVKSIVEHEMTMLTIVRQLLQVVSYLHDRLIAHRDIRMETVEVYQSSEH